MNHSPTVFETHLTGLSLIHRGKVRDVYALDDAHMLIVTTDRLSAFDVVLPDPIPEKGRVLTEISNFWFERTRPIVANHLTGLAVEDFVSNPAERDMLAGRSIVVKRLKALPVEAIIRGYLIGSGWKDYQASGELCGIRLQSGLRMAEQLPTPIFTPATKAAVGEHDENVSAATVAATIGSALTAQIERTALALYQYAAQFARERGIIIADTKFEFGLDSNNELVLIDEILTPDSSRFWPADRYTIGQNPPSFDKQYVRDYLETLDWNKRAPGPRLPTEVIQGTTERYLEARRRLIG